MAIRGRRLVDRIDCSTSSICGLGGAQDEFLLTATVQNLKRLAQHATSPAASAYESLTNAKQPNSTPSIDQQLPQPIG